MYRTLLVCDDEREEVSDLMLMSRTTAGSYGKVINYADRAVTIDGVTSLVNPTEGVFDSIASLETLRGKYISLNDAIYYIPEDVGFVQASIGDGTIITSYVARASHAQKIYIIGFRVWSGVSEANAIQTVKITGSSNNGDDLMLGSVCASLLEAKIYSKNSDIYISAGAVLKAYKVNDAGTETLIGTYNVETAEWMTKRTYKITAYDNVRKLDRDITAWVRSLTGWPYSLTEFYGMLCAECGLEGTHSTWEGASAFTVHKFDVEDGTTARQLMGSICEAMGDYCIALPDGRLTANWYRTESTRIYYSKALMPGDDPLKETFRFQNGLSHGDFDVEDVGYVQIREKQDEKSPLWPDYGADADASNAYIITGNPILLSHPTYKTDSADPDSVRTALTKIAARFDYAKYRPFTATVSEAPGMTPGKYVYVGDVDNNIMFISPITHMVWNGHRMTLECTAKRTRRDAGSPNNWTGAKMKEYVDKTRETGTSGIPGNVVTCDLEGATEDESAVRVNADTLGGELPEYYTRCRSAVTAHIDTALSSGVGERAISLAISTQNGDLFEQGDGVIICKADGYVLVSGHVFTQGNSGTNYIGATIKRSSIAEVHIYANTTVNTTPVIVPLTLVRVSAGDTLELYVSANNHTITVPKSLRTGITAIYIA